MLSVTDQTRDLYGAMHIPSNQVGDAGLPMIQDPSRSPDSIAIAARGGDTPQHEKLRQLTEAGLGYYNQGKFEEAAKYYEEALDLCPDSMPALISFGAIAGHLRRYEESKGAFERLLRLLEKQRRAGDATLLAKAHHGIGLALLSLWAETGPQEPPLEVVSEGELEFRQALSLDPTYFEAWLGLSMALHIMERLDDAEAAVRKAIEVDPDRQVAKERLREVLEDKLERRLFELGYLSKINKPIRDFTPYENRTLIEVEGKPLSEIIIEERG